MKTEEFKKVLQERFAKLMNSLSEDKSEENIKRVDEEIKAISHLYRVLEKNHNL